MNKPNIVGRLVQWTVKLSEFDINSRPKTTMKAQALADFIAEFTSKEDEPHNESGQESPQCTINIDRSLTKSAGGVGVILESPDGDLIRHAACSQYATTNDEAEYEALLIGLRITKALGAMSLKIHNDSQLVMGHVNEDYKAKEGRMQQYLRAVRHQIA